MPFSHAGRFHLFYLLDENHHQGLGGLGGHQWAHASTTDLIHWEQHPLAIAITDEDEGSICTGSVLFHEGKFYGFYATRRRDWTQHLSLAISEDGIHFEKVAPNPLASPPPGYSPVDFRDPFPFIDREGRLQVLVTARLTEYPLHDRGGCLLRLSSEDGRDWLVEEPFLIPGGAGYQSVPECPDYFYWNGWYYLIFGMGLQTYYRMSREPDGPWLRPANDSLGNRLLAVMKTAPFRDDRRIGAGWIGSRRNARDSEPTMWGGNIVLREIIQQPDGTLGTAFLPESLPGIDAPKLPLEMKALTDGASGNEEKVDLAGSVAQEAAVLSALPQNFHLRCHITPQAGSYAFGLGLRGSGQFEAFYPLTFYPARQVVQLAEERIDCVAGLDRSFDLEVIVCDDIIDVCVGGSRCLINRLGELKGDRLFLFAECAAVTFEEIGVRSYP